ncbi:MAG: hypothetical protein ACKO0Z_07030 [Betaproteobacteria bacterium]
MVKYSDIVEKRNIIWRVQSEVALIDDFKNALAVRSKPQITMKIYGENPVLSIVPDISCLNTMLDAQRALRILDIAAALQWFKDNGIDPEAE